MHKSVPILICSIVVFSFMFSVRNHDAQQVEKNLNSNNVATELSKGDTTNLYVFVGEKIYLKPFEPELDDGEILMDRAFKAKYKLIQNVYGNYGGDTIEFEAYDHYGSPDFGKFKNVLLFVSKREERLYHVKYQYFDVYITKEGRWASCGDSYRFDEHHREPLKAVPLDFEEPVTFDLKGLSAKEIQELYPKDYFETKGNSAICRKGNYVEELFLVKKLGVLKAREIFR